VRRTSRLLVLFGIGLAVLTFVLIVALLPQSGNNQPPPGASPTIPANLTVVTAAVDIPLGTAVTAAMLTTATLPSNAVQPDVYLDPSQVISQVARQTILTGAQVTRSQFSINQAITQLTVPSGKRAISLYVSDLTGVGRLINIGDSVDVLVTFDEATIKVLTIQPGSNNTAQHDDAFRPLTVKAPLLLENIQVIGTLIPPAPAPATTNNQAANASPAPSQGAVADANAQKLIILAVTDAQAEAILFARTGGTVDLVLRSPADASAPPQNTSGVILKTMFQTYGVVPPYVFKTLPIFLPAQ
jgi:Flp pilus assembly protein CpaB